MMARQPTQGVFAFFVLLYYIVQSARPVSGTSLLRSRSSWPTEGSLIIDDLTLVSSFDQITILGDVKIVKKGILAIEGDEASLFALDMHVSGLINFVLSYNGPTEAINIEGELVLDEDSSPKLSIDASEYAGGEGVIHLIRYASHTGVFSPNNVMVIGLDSRLSAELVNGPESLDLIIMPNPQLQATARDRTGTQQPKDDSPRTAGEESRGDQLPEDSDGSMDTESRLARFRMMFKVMSHHDTNQRYHLVNHG